MRVWWLGVALAACEPVPSGALADVTFAPGVRLDTHADVAFRVDGAWDDVLVVRLEDGRQLYGGPGTLPATRPVRVRVPGGTSALEVELRDGSAPITIPVVDGEAVYVVPR